MQTQLFLHKLRNQVLELLQVLATELEPCATAALQFKPSPTAWSALECLEHLNRYSRFYNSALQRAVHTSGPAYPTVEVRIGWLGRKTYESVRPENRKLQTTLKHLNPNQSALSRTVQEEFRQHQETLLQLLDAAATLDLNRKQVPVEFFRWLKLRTGEALLFMVAHQQRHMQQAQRVLQLYRTLQATPAQPVLMVG